MSKPMTLNVRVTGPLSDFVAANVGDSGAYENVSEYVRDLIRRDMAEREAENFARLRAELQQAFSHADESFVRTDVDAFFKKVRPKSAG
ncbi:ribbon-helix-helix domain-containing protein [Phenylobacterium sp.]|jgi:antitoxin ParD1/3/4|uniref:ribbon-helix-helix domain-containing protein n=1 Tax=Phenylobacterium sp. TaxID=1871053 RepID=UPI0040364743